MLFQVLILPPTGLKVAAGNHIYLAEITQRILQPI